ncbi:hypothetical protein [Pseudomonas sp. TWRC1-2]|uniref:hypothetical protein n=1 Tax=Pseudomonas sp. TWRC1-2 TaxID=2804628 RepID=UPI003CE9147B
MSYFLAGLFFAAVPALAVGLVIAFFSGPLGVVVVLGVFGFGLDLCFRGSGREERP